MEFHPNQDGSCQISCKASSDKTGLSNGAKSTADGQAVQCYTLAEGNTHQGWYFELADEGNISAAPEDGKVYYLRGRRSGQYVDIYKASNVAGTKAMQHYYNGGKNQQYRLIAYDADYYYLEPLHAPGMALAKSGKVDDKYDRLALESRTEGAASQLFRFEEIEAGKGTGYAVVCKDGEQAWDVMNYSYEVGADIILTAHGDPQDNKWWILEECSERMESSMTYTANQRQVASVTDARGNMTKYTYDENERLLQSVEDAKGNVTSYTYDANTDQLTGVSKTVDDGTASVAYAYENDRLKSITHNGFQYNFAYDVYGNKTAVSVGDQELARTVYRNRNGLVERFIYDRGRRLNPWMSEKSKKEEAPNGKNE